jgi:uncharacterized damage-inducible protein DinB
MENGPQSVMELASCTGMAHPNQIQLIKELQAENWVHSKTSSTDKRVKIIELSEHGYSQRDKLMRIWTDMRKTVNVMVDEGEVDFWSALTEFESSFAKKSFHQRLNEQIMSTKMNMQLRHPGKWFERNFDFEHLSTTSTVILERLSQTTTLLRSKLSPLSDYELEKSNEKWSMKQNVGHLTDLEPIWLIRVNDILSGKEIMREIDLSNRKTNEANHNHIPVLDLIANFETERAKLLEISWSHFDELESRSSIHPRLGIKMKIRDLLYFVAEHDSHHLATIDHLINQIHN